jgi:8-oxo-dGTP pyrophosphatase MutT (NUDIX family)
MHRRPLLKLLDEYAALYPDEQSVAARIRRLVESRPDCFERTCRPGHVTASAWVTTPDRRQVLLVHHRNLDRWLQPGGHADGQTDAAAVALREVEEETGLVGLRIVAPFGVEACEGPLPFDLDVHLIPPRRSPQGEVVEGAHEHHDVRFHVVAAGNLTVRLSDESHDVRWFDADELRSVTDEESVLRMDRKCRRLS